ncbi:MAG: DegV family protein [Anaerolineales bacterium]|nr:DegV family protein [Anaerolineales bacterium]
MISDTTACLLRSVQIVYEIPVIPKMIHFREISLTEGLEIANISFLEELRSSECFDPCPPPVMFSSIFLTRQDPGVPIFCIHSSSHISENIRSAETAKLNIFELNIPVIDTQLLASP